MSHRKALAASIALTFALAISIFGARARLFQSTTSGADGLVPPPAAVDARVDVPPIGGLEATTTPAQTTGTLRADEESARPVTHGETRSDDTFENGHDRGDD